jgi:hypothetical protein
MAAIIQDKILLPHSCRYIWGAQKVIGTRGSTVVEQLTNESKIVDSNPIAGKVNEKGR